MLKIKGLRAGYGAVEVLRGVDIEVGEGELVTVIGSNGAGKTTLLRTISGLVRATSGTIEFDGRELVGLPPDRIVKAGVIHVPEGRMVLGKLSVLENLQLGAYVRNDHEAVAEDLETILDMFPWLKDRLRQAAGTLSGGEQQMLAIGRGLMGRPRLLLLDEPSLGVAPIIVDQIFGVIETVMKKGLTIFLIEQNASRALGIAAKGYALEFGAITVSGRGSELLSDDRVRQAYLGI
jgi:branched-chain amino acid transport system ATP-binding protein